MESPEITVPVLWEFPQERLELDTPRFFLRRLELSLDGVGASLAVGGRDIVGIDLPQRRMLFDLLVKQRLSDRGIVDFAMAVAAITNQINHHIGPEIIAVFGSHARNPDDGVAILGVDVENRDGLAARNAGGEAR